MPQILFQETQSFKNPWVRWLVILGVGAMAFHWGRGFYEQIIKGRPFGSGPMSDFWLMVVSFFMFALAACLLWLAFRLCLEVRIYPDHLCVRMFPLVNKRILIAQIKEFEVVEYNPLKEYGGWGVKWGGPKRGWAYNISGTKGLSLRLSSGQRLLIGSQKPAALARAITQAKSMIS